MYITFRAETYVFVQTNFMKFYLELPLVLLVALCLPEQGTFSTEFHTLLLNS